jgi:hypothetical protein
MQMLKNRTLIVGTLAVALAVTAAASSTAASAARGDSATLSFNRPVALPGLTLAPGTYVFEIFDSASSNDVVRVSRAATKTHEFLGLTQRVDRPARMKGLSAVTLGESRPGEPARITVWYPADGSDGRKFLY